MKTLYLDMDGVLCDFNKRYTELFGVEAASTRERKEHTPQWKEFIEGRNFTKLDWYPGADELLHYVKSLEGKVEIEILSSSGGELFHDRVLEQKLQWLNDHSITYKANITNGSRKKALYASGKNRILVDDTDYVIKAFIEAGGIGIWHRDVKDTIKLIEDAIALD
jgi:5'-nucleotidase